MINKDTICAIATSNNTIAGISIIRISGDKSLEIAKKFINKFRASEEIVPRKMYLSDIELSNGKDKCLAVYFNAPYSFTGEDIVELHLHGGTKLTELALKRCLEFGCRLATRGEFSKRAFLNGKQSLESLEGVIDIINAESEAELSANFNLANGKVRQELEKIQDELTSILAEIDVGLDYPEEDIEYASKQKIRERIEKVISKIDNLLNANKSGRKIKDGINVAIIGKPNVGKSTLLNALLNYDRAIVTNVAGTTRDSIEETFEYRGVKFNICDTAGIRTSSDEVESIGIERAIEKIKSSNIILFVTDSTRKLDSEEEKIIELLQDCCTPIIFVENKIDEVDDENDDFYADFKRHKIEDFEMDEIIEELKNSSLGEQYPNAVNDFIKRVKGCKANDKHQNTESTSDPKASNLTATNNNICTCEKVQTSGLDDRKCKNGYELICDGTDFPYLIPTQYYYNTFIVNEFFDIGGTDDMLFELPSLVKSVAISAKNNENIDKLKETLYDLTLGKSFDATSLLITNERHLEALKNAKASLNHALSNLSTSSLDCIALDIREAWNNLATITGKEITVEILDEIFTKFCLGK